MAFNRLMRFTGVLIIISLLMMVSSAVAASPLPPAEYFVDDTGTGTDCTQASPCSLATALAKPETSFSVYLAGGTYTGTGSEVIYLDKDIDLYGGWNGSLTYPPDRDPDFIQSIIDGQDTRRGITVMGDGSPLSPVISGLYITNGNASGLTTNCLDGPGGDASGCGGGIFIYLASPLIMGKPRLRQHG